MDQAVALADFNGLLVVFGKDSILLYENADDITNMALLEGINNIGCVARDSVQAIGKDLVFMSDSGLRSLSRAIMKDEMPLTDLSVHVRGDLIAELLAETDTLVSSVYNAIDGFYLLSFPTVGKSWYFDLKYPNEDGSWKVATWDISPTSLYYTSDNVLYCAVTDGYISTYTGYFDESDSDAANGSPYFIDYEGVWNDFSSVSEEVSNYLKILKNVSVLGSGTAASSVSFKWAVDYSQVFNSIALTFNQEAPAAYGTAQYDINTFAATGDFERVRTPISSAGQVLIYGLTTTINGDAFALQRMDILAKIGRLAI